MKQFIWFISSIPVVLLWFLFVHSFKAMCHFGKWMGFDMRKHAKNTMVWNYSGVCAFYSVEKKK